MFNVLIVDDEYLVRIGIKQTINWQEYGFEICGEAQNGIEGYEKYIELKPDIIITDIRMKKATGIELIGKLKETEGFDSEIVILTAYDEFDYAKKALENGVGAYILKPIKESELISVMLDLRSKIEKRRQMENIIENLTPHMSYFKQSFLKDIFMGNITDKKEIENKCSFYDIELPTNEYTIANIKVDNLNTFVGDVNYLHENLLDTIEYCSKMPDGLKYIACTLDLCTVSLIIFYHDDNYKLLQSSFSNLKNFLIGIKEQFQITTSQTISIGHSMGQLGADEIKTAYKEAHKALVYKSFVGSNSVIDYTSVPKEMSGALVIPNTDIDEMLIAISIGNKEAVGKILNMFYSKIRKTPTIDIESLKDVVLEMIIILLRYNFKNIEDINKVYGRNLVPSNELKVLETVNDIMSWIDDIVSKMFLYEHTDCSNQNHKVIGIIERDYATPLTVVQVAEELHISTYYLMHLFKEETGKTFNQFLTEYRIGKAKSFIKNSNYKIYEIGDLVGYKDPTYFSYVFKKVTGVTPKKYAESTIV